MTLADIQRQDPRAAFAISRTLPLEGGLVDNPHDPGGVTSMGVSLRYALAEAKVHPESARFFDVDHDGFVTHKDIAGLTKDEAAEIYFNCWWALGWYANLTPDIVSWKCFDIAVNTGPKRAALILQKALCDAGSPVAVDAVVGPGTIAAVTRQASIDDGAKLLSEIRQEQAAFYRGLAAKEPDLRRFLKGWLNRAAA